MKPLLPAIKREMIRERLYQYYLLTRLHRPIGLFLLLWPTLWALWIAAEGFPRPGVFVVFVLGVILMRSAGCVINDYADRHFDPHVARTRERPIASGRVTPREALGLFATLCLLAFLLVLTMNRLTVYLAFVGVGLAAIYPFMKRYTHLPQVVLGMAFGWAIPMAFAAQAGDVPKVAWLLFVINVVWSVAYDSMYAMADRDEDLKIGVKSAAILFGDADRFIIGLLQGLMFLGLVLLGRELALGAPYYMGLLVALGLAGYQQYLIRDRRPAECFRAFLNNHWLGAAVFVGLFLAYI
ncbi:4-hydroxybenzoate octaprenyltransferase [Thiohalophilus sp.]|uniref:4-hydroxybenzoate octaprenyltransferase n=1 Tax=Thiohalophilus sp. TaxID=3028392 RepID=UPI002ACE5C66|nr:4-hydroxybenzoate octaprenyltransferase [Thiohalophilus sp.]MDZ7661734.1 4-hydroxybenzoate octaprenyltransferase [Thiohalophilus sp.]